MLQAILEKQGLNEYWIKEFFKEFGHGVDKLTQQEARHLKKPMLEQIQDRIQKARQSLTQSPEQQNESRRQVERTEQYPIHQALETEQSATGRAEMPSSNGNRIAQNAIRNTNQHEKGTDRLVTQTTSNRLYLYTSYEDLKELQKLKAQGLAKFDPEYKVWYGQEKDKQLLPRWTTRPTVPSDEEALSNYLRENRIEVEAGHPVFDDRIHRLRNEGYTERNVMYQAYANPNGVPFARITNFSKGDRPDNWQYPREYLSILRNIEAVEQAKISLGRLLTSSSQGTTNSPVAKPLQQQPKDEEKIAKANHMAELSKVIVSISEFTPLP